MESYCQTAQVEDRMCIFGRGGKENIEPVGSTALNCNLVLGHLPGLLLTKSWVVRDCDSEKVENVWCSFCRGEGGEQQACDFAYLLCRC